MPDSPEIPAEVILSVGETYQLALPGLATAGYRWEDSVDGDLGSVSTCWRRGFPTDPHRVGASTPECLEISAEAPGRVRIHVCQRRPWESGAPRDEHLIAVIVTKRRLPDEQ